MPVTGISPFIHNALIADLIVILSDSEILRAIETGDIVIQPYRRECLGTNSYDVHLGEWLATYDDEILDARKHNTVTSFRIPEEGYVLEPHSFYLGVTLEYTEAHKHVPFLEGKSSIGRLGIDIHATAGKGDVGFCNHWTLEISVKQPIRVYAGMPIGQLIYFATSGDVQVPYNRKGSAKYNDRCDKPVESMMWKNFEQKLFVELIHEKAESAAE
jgi:dCTP deaminase